MTQAMDSFCLNPPRPHETLCGVVSLWVSRLATWRFRDGLSVTLLEVILCFIFYATYES